MKILIAPDSFKNALSSLDVANSLKKGIEKTSTHQIKIQRLSDGGEGAIDIILEDNQFKKITIPVSNPLGKIVEASYAINYNKGIAFIEMATAAGLGLINHNERNPLNTTTYGVGELIVDAYKKGIRNIYLSLGGSATNDGGAGILSALGVEFWGVKNTKLSNSDLKNISEINSDSIKIKDCKFKILVDVNNSLLGKNGATNIYASQKGAKKEDFEKLESNLKHFAEIVEKHTGNNYLNLKGTGAAGGIAFGLKSFFDVEVISGITEMMKFCDLEKQITDADIVISGEGSLDSQSINGKLISGLSDMCYKHKKPFILVAGIVKKIDINDYFNKGCIAIIPIQDRKQSLEKSIEKTHKMLEVTGESISDLLSFF